MPVRRAVGLLAVACSVVACSSGSKPAPPPDVTPTPTPTTTEAVRLTAASVLGVRFERPVGWSGHLTSSGAASGNVTFTAPGRRGSLYVERNDCAACVDRGLVAHGHRDNTPDPGNALTSYFPTSHRTLNGYAVAFTTAASKPYVARGKLLVTRNGATLTGYVVVIVTLPTTESSTAARILSSVQV
ncbi:MAG: hypothetical protein ACJ735_02630 [Actinomycetes bacterium]